MPGVMTSAFRAVAFLLVAMLAGSAAAQTPPVSSRAVPPAPPDLAAPPADAEKTGSGLTSKVIQPGTGTTHPGANDLVTVNYTGWTADGRAFDSTVTRGRPSTFLLERVMPGWREGVPLMVAGEKRRFWVPEALAFKGAKDRPAGTLVFDIELIEFAPPPSTPPPDVAVPPADASRTPSGLAYKVLRPGTGTARPTRRNRVTVHYTGWTTDGKMFDSSVMRGQPATFGLEDVIKGWTEGVPLMVVGEKTRFWIPQKLAYDGQAGAPRGMLVFDIELIAIEP
jgi:peptidylprolyl isomerase